MRLVLYKEQMGGMLVGVTPRSFWYISSGKPVVVVRAYLFRRRPVGPGWLVASFFFVPRSPRDKFQPWVPCHLFFVCKPVVVGGHGP